MPTKKTAPLDPKTADRLLDLLGDSDEFRELFQQDPAAALARIGHESDDYALRSNLAAQPSIAGCLAVSELASKDAIRSAHAELRKMLLAGLAQTTPSLDAALGSSD